MANEDDSKLWLIRPELRALFARAGASIAVTGTSADATRALLAESRQEAAQADVRFERLERLATLGQAGASLTHEVRNVMTGVLGFTQVAAARLQEKPASARELLQQIDAEVHRCLDILNHFLSFMRGDARELTPVDPKALLDEVEALVKHRVTLANAQIEMSVPKSLPRVRGSANSLKQVFVNLVHNALNAMPDGGTIRFSVVTEDGGALRITVSDTGDGVPAALHEKIFEPFFTTRQHAEGTGLGLYVSRAIIEAHGGTLELDGAQGPGACFEIRIPVMT